jgi:hypothetical protein
MRSRDLSWRPLTVNGIDNGLMADRVLGGEVSEVYVAGGYEVDGDGGELVSRWYSRGDGTEGQQCQGSEVDKDDNLHIKAVEWRAEP